jgi:hypothetical protein
MTGLAGRRNTPSSFFRAQRSPVTPIHQKRQESQHAELARSVHQAVRAVSMYTTRGRKPVTRPREGPDHRGAGSARASTNNHVVPIRTIVRRNGTGHHGNSAATRREQDPPDPQDDPRTEALRCLARQLKTLTWSPALLALLLDELYVEDIFSDVVGDPDTIPAQGYAHAVAVAIALRHSWRPDDLEAVARRLGDIAGPRKGRAPQSGSRGQRRPG